MRSSFRFFYAAGLGFVLSLSSWGQIPTRTRSIVVHVDVPPLAWSGSTLEEKLIRRLSRYENGRVITAQRASLAGRELPADLYNLDSLVDWGKEAGGGHLLLVDIDSQCLQRKKSFHLPLVFHKYETVGMIEGEVRLIDVMRGKLLIAEPFKVEQKGRRIFQATMDDDVNDPAIHMTAPEKIRFFKKLEDKLALRIVDRVGRVMRLR